MINLILYLGLVCGAEPREEEFLKAHIAKQQAEQCKIIKDEQRRKQAFQDAKIAIEEAIKEGQTTTSISAVTYGKIIEDMLIQKLREAGYEAYVEGNRIKISFKDAKND